MKKRLFKSQDLFLFVFILLFAAITTGCNSSSKEGKQQTGTPNSSQSLEKRTESAQNTELVATFGEPDPIASPEAQIGGTYNLWGAHFPKSLNMFRDYNALSAQITGLLFEPLVTLHSVENKPQGVLAESWSITNNGQTFRFVIHPSAKWSDGKPITAEDVQFYYDVIMNKQNLTSLFRVGLRRFERPVVLDSKTVEITAKESHWKNFYEAGGFFAFPKHIWEGMDFNKINFDFPVVSGPYALSQLKQGRTLVLKRRSDWWGRVQRYNIGKYNFSKVRFRFISDRNKALEVFKKGDLDALPIYTSSTWIKKTDFPAVKKSWVARQEVYNQEPKGFQGFAINMRKSKFADVRIREALCYLLNRELMNEKLMHNVYFLLNSYFPDLYPGYINPNIPVVAYNPSKARALLEAAGWKVNSQGQLAHSESGDVFSIQFITAQEDLRHLNVYVEDLKKVGIQATIEKLSWSSISKRMDQKNFDMYWAAWGASRLKDPERPWSSTEAEELASQNWPGVQDAVVDSIIDLLKVESDIDKRNRLLQHLDTRLMEIKPYALLWQSGYHRVLYWKKFGMPQNLFGKYGDASSILEYWWISHEKEKTLERVKQENVSLPSSPGQVYYQD
jgi:microcin C transport system substrate-binding protein